MPKDEFGEYSVLQPWTLNDFREHPLFMKPEDVPADISLNPHLEGLRQLLYADEPPADMAEKFRQMGNDYFRETPTDLSTQNALLCYTRGLEMDCGDKALESQLYSNRSAVSLRLEEYSKAVDDARFALKLDPSNVKAHFRAARASKELGLTAQGLKFVDAALRLQPGDKQLGDLRKTLQQMLKKEDAAREAARRADEEASRDRAADGETVRKLLAKRGITLGKPLYDVAMYAQQGGGNLVPLQSSEEEALQWPCVFVYDEHGQSDFVAVFDERCALEDQLEEMFPALGTVDWDQEGKYVWDRLSAYLEYWEQNESRVKRVDTTEALAPQLEGLRVSACLVFHILVRDSPAEGSFVSVHHLK